MKLTVMIDLRFFLLSFLVLNFTFVFSGWAQDDTYKDYLGIKSFAIDFPSYFDGTIRETERYDYGLGLEYARHLSKHFALGSEFHYAVIDYKDENGSFILDERMYAVDMLMKYKHFNHQRFFNFDIFAGIGGFTAESIDLSYQIPFGVNFLFRIKDKWHAQLQGQFRYHSDKHLGTIQAGIGIVHLLGPGAQIYEEPELPMADIDGDGIADALDNCPTMAGTQELSGCPDSDGDMVSDVDDRCPKIPGLKDNFGCPLTSATDTDGDGTKNDKDDCPDTPGLRKNNGCPDRDLDGIIDKKDKCPDDYGQEATNGCPDTDGDGIGDDKDECPSIAANTANGCPPIAVTDKEYFAEIQNEITFETGSSELTSESKTILTNVKNILDRYPGRILSIEGHTDNTGSAELNQNLSEERAKSCFNYLVQLGASPTQLRYRGFGETNPIADNESAAGKARNRRVEFHFIGE